MFKEPINRKNLQIETERLLLVSITLDYTQDIFTEFDAEITKYMVPTPAKDINAMADYINELIQKNTNQTWAYLVILDKISKEFLGYIWLHAAQTDIPELGLRIKKSAHGKKYWLEATQWLMKRTQKNLIFDYIVYPVDHRNIASRKIPEKLWWETDWTIIKKKTLDPNKNLEILTYKIYS